MEGIKIEKEEVKLNLEIAWLYIQKILGNF